LRKLVEALQHAPGLTAVTPDRIARVFAKAPSD